MNTVSQLLKKGFKFPIYPSVEQKQLLEQTFGCCRYVYNRGLAEAKSEFKTYLELTNTLPLNPPSKPDVSGYGFVNRLTQYKEDLSSYWLNEVSAVALQQAMLHLGHAFTTFFKNKKGYPKFKKKQQDQSFNLMKTGFSIKDGQFKIAKCKDPIKVVFSRQLPSEPSSCTISRTSTGKYYVSFTCEYLPKPTTGIGAIGIDLGIKDFAVLSNSTRIANPKNYLKAQQILKRRQQALSRCKPGSNRRNKARIAVAKIHAYVSNTRHDFQHKLSRQLVNENQVIGAEKLMVKNMVQNRHLAKHISDASWASFTQKLQYKVIESQYATLVYMDPFFPSSHLCSKTGIKLGRKLNLAEREWWCHHCGHIHDRDVNAAQNILNKSLETLAKYDARVTAGKIVLAKR